MKERDSYTGHVRDVKHAHDSLKDTGTWHDQTVPIAEGAIPPLVSLEVWDKVQEVLAAAAAFHNRGGPRRADPMAHSTLLDGGYVFCAECGCKMTRFWQRRDGKPYYQCHKGAGVPFHEHPRQAINAAKVDALVLQTLARALTHPEEVLLIADAAETERLQAEADLQLAQAQDAATTQRLTDLTAEQDHVLTALGALAQVSGVETEMARLRARLTALDKEQQDLLTLKRDAHTSHAESRAVILRSLFTARDLIFLPSGGLEEVGTGHLLIGQTMTTLQAAAFLETSDLQLLVRAGEPFTYETDSGEWEHDTEADTVLTADVLYARLKSLPRDSVRAVLRAHGVVVKVKPPQARSEWTTTGPTKAAERVEVVLHGSLVLRPTQIGIVRANQKLMSKMS